MGKPTICIGENKGAADQRLCFPYVDSTIPLLSKSKISCLQPSSVLVQLGLCLTWSETTLLVFPRDGSFLKVVHYGNIFVCTKCFIIKITLMVF